MTLAHRNLPAGALAALLLAAAVPAEAQIYVYPRRPSQTPNVHYHEFDWRYVDLLRGQAAEQSPEWNPGRRAHPLTWWGSPDGTEAVGKLRSWTDPLPAALAGATPPADSKVRPPSATPKRARSGGIRLYFYESERATAERAAASIVESYQKLIERFRYTPTRTVPYFLYDSYIEFLQTNLFPIQEGVLGVTSSRGLEMSLPYFGDHRFFHEVSTHEFAHQFTFQKLGAVATAAKTKSDPLQQFPLWFLEGLAEYYAHDGLDPEGEVLIRDLILDPDPEEGYAFTDFFSDAYGYLPTYKLGQARCAFLQETYGPWFIQQVLEQSVLMVQVPDRKQTLNFKQLLTRLTGDSPRTIHEKFTTWVKQRAYSVWLNSSPKPDQLMPVEGGPEDAFALAGSPDGNLLMVRSANMRTRQFVLRLFDPRAPGSGKTIAHDSVRGVESLHPVAPRNFTIGRTRLAWVAQTRGHDVIYWHDYTHRAERGAIIKPDRYTQKVRREKGWRAHIKVGGRHTLDLEGAGVSVVESIALSPDDRRVAVIGTARGGRRDVWVADLTGGRLTRVTDDWFSEREVTWGPGGLVYTSDSTGHGMYDLFRVRDPDRPAPERLTHGGRDALDPVALADGRILYVAHDGTGANVYELFEDGLVLRRTRAATGLYDVTGGPDGHLWALHVYEGRRVPSRIDRRSLLSEPMNAPAEDPIPPREPWRVPITGDADYKASSVSNWQLLFAFANIAYGRNYRGDNILFGSLAAIGADRLRNHVIGAVASAYGSFALTTAELFYANQEHRLQWQASVFQDLRPRFDDTFRQFDDPQCNLCGFYSIDRFFGARGVIRYPFDQFLHLQGGLGLGYVDFLLDPSWGDYLESSTVDGMNARDYWESENAGMRPRAEGSVSIGYSDLRGHPFTGPIAGSSAMLALSGTVDPTVPTGWVAARLDAEHYIPLIGRSNIAMRMSAGQMAGGRDTPGYYLYSSYTLRGVPLGTTELLFGETYGFGILELQFPLDALIRVLIFDLEGVIGVDFGGVGDNPRDAWRNRVLDFALGVNLALGPLELRWHYANPVDVGGRILPNDGDWVTNISLGYRYQ